MVGKIVKMWKYPPGIGFIQGDDGVEYYLHWKNCTKHTKTFKEGNFVEFDIGEVKESTRPYALNIRKIGHGVNHPFARDIQVIGDNILKFIPDDCESKQYMLRNIDAIYKYFCNVKDCDQYSNPKEHFRNFDD